MSSVTLTPPAVSRLAVNPWYVATAVVVPTFMEILDTTIATASLRYIAGGLSATMNDSDWVMTSYLAANATILPITGWISAHMGRATTSSSPSPSSRSPRCCAGWPPASKN